MRDVIDKVEFLNDKSKNVASPRVVLLLTETVHSGPDPLAGTVPPPAQVPQVGPHVNTVLTSPKHSLQPVRFFRV